jgi:hypothetical protein
MKSALTTNTKDDMRFEVMTIMSWIGKDAIAIARIMMSSNANSARSAASSAQRIADFCKLHKSAICFPIALLGKRAPAPVKAAVSFAFYHEADEQLSNWCEIMATGLGLTPLSRTVLGLREKLLKNPDLAHSGKTREFLVKISMRSIEAYCAGEVLTKFYEPSSRIYTLPPTSSDLDISP